MTGRLSRVECPSRGAKEGVAARVGFVSVCFENTDVQATRAVEEYDSLAAHAAVPVRDGGGESRKGFRPLADLFMSRPGTIDEK